MSRWLSKDDLNSRVFSSYRNARYVGDVLPDTGNAFQAHTTTMEMLGPRWNSSCWWQEQRHNSKEGSQGCISIGKNLFLSDMRF